MIHTIASTDARGRKQEEKEQEGVVICKAKTSKASRKVKAKSC